MFVASLLMEDAGLLPGKITLGIPVPKQLHTRLLLFW
jgi:hypothetical protein